MLHEYDLFSLGEGVNLLQSSFNLLREEGLGIGLGLVVWQKTLKFCCQLKHLLPSVLSHIFFESADGIHFSVSTNLLWN